MTEREQTIEFHRNYCVQYTPRGKCWCAKGVDRDKLKKAEIPGTGGRMVPWGPCIGGHTLENPLAFCPHWERRSMEEAVKYADGMEACMKRMLMVDPVISAWRKKGPKGKSEVIECPACKGLLHLRQSSYNGHVQARCETEDCVNFVE